VTVPLIIGNWKMNMLTLEACRLAKLLVDNSIDDVDVVIAPPFTSIYAISQNIRNSRLGLAGQNFHSEIKGPYTGEISLEMLKDVGCRYVLIGHSERRQLFGECDRKINTKLHLALQKRFTAVLCIGETQRQRDAGETQKVIKTQLSEGLAGLSEESIAGLVIAYEPVWAIGTGVNATPEQAVEVHKFIRNFLFESQRIYKKVGIRIIYGGSVTPENCKELLREKEINGALVGGASLNFESFCAIVKSSLES
jgi:triosephosphate isomerase (TIM)